MHFAFEGFVHLCALLDSLLQTIHIILLPPPALLGRQLVLYLSPNALQVFLLSLSDLGWVILGTGQKDGNPGHTLVRAMLVGRTMPSSANIFFSSSVSLTVPIFRSEEFEDSSGRAPPLSGKIGRWSRGGGGEREEGEEREDRGKEGGEGGREELDKRVSTMHKMVMHTHPAQFNRHIPNYEENEVSHTNTHLPRSKLTHLPRSQTNTHTYPDPN